MTESRAPDQSANKRQATSVLSDCFVYCSYAVILILAIFRLQWFLRVLHSVQNGGDKTAFEDPHEQALGAGYFLVTGDPSILCYLAVTLAFLLLLFFGRQELESNTRRILIAIRATFFYSLAMILTQIVFLDLFAKPEERSWYTFNTCLQRNGPVGPINVFCVDDPHYVTLVVSLFALILLIDRNIIGAIVKLFKGLQI